MSVGAVSLVRALYAPGEAFRALAAAELDAVAVFLRQILWLALLPPAFATIGTANFGWRLGASEPLYLAPDELALVAIGYFFVLLAGFVGTAGATRWMAVTYGARNTLGHGLALMAVVALPLVAGSAAHLFPHVFLNILVLIPALIWSMYLLYTGLPVVLATTPERGMLMASALIGLLLVGAVTTLDVTVALWSMGIGPSIAV